MSRIAIAVLLIPRELPAPPMVVFPIRIEHALNVAVQRSHDADAREHGRGPPDVATSIRASIAACHSAVPASFFGSATMYAAASFSVTSGLPFGVGIGSSNRRFQPRLLMAPTLLIEFDFKSPWAFAVPCHRQSGCNADTGLRRCHKCRRARLPMGGQGGSRKPSRSPRTPSKSCECFPRVIISPNNGVSFSARLANEPRFKIR
jgi:hypothetical protein